MGRYSTGVWTIYDGSQINISDLVRQGVIQRGQANFVSWVWKENGVAKRDIRILAVYLNSAQYVRFIYTLTRKNGEKVEVDYEIELIERPSNLGVGKVLFFKCPVSQKPCRKLYLSYDSTIFKSQKAYQNRIYYPSQQSAKRSRSNDQYWHFKNQIEQLSKGRVVEVYAGKTTKRAARINRLSEKKEVLNWARWMPDTFPIRLRRGLQTAMKNGDYL